MRLPSKVTPFKDSVLSLFPILLNEVKKGDITPIKLFGNVRDKIGGISNFMITLDCLFALNKIKLNEEIGELTYVD